MNRELEPARPLLLSEIQLFQGLSSNDFTDIARRCKVRHFVRQELILARHQNSSDVHFISRGRVRITSFSKGGKETTYHDKSVGDVFGELAAIDGAARAADVVALEDTTTVSTTAEVFRDLLARYPTVNQRLLKQLAANIRGLTDRVFEFTALGVSARIRAELYRLGKSANEAVQEDRNRVLLDPAPKHVELASRVATTREAVTREINTLVKMGLVQKNGPQKLLLLDLNKLAEAID